MLRRTALASALCASLVLSGAAHGALAVGQPAPDFRLADTAGKSHALSDFRGRFVVLEWNNPGCPFVRKHYNSANMQTLQKESVAKGVVWLAINSTEGASGDYLSPEQLGRWMREQQASPTATLMDEDGNTGRAYGARTTPHMYIVDPQGRLAYAGGIDSIPSGRIDDIARATNYVRQALQEALAGKPISAAITRPYGCSVKYKS